MSPSEIYSVLTEVFQEVFDDDGITLSADTTADDIEGWDSQAHVNLVVAAETRFGVRFRTAELETLHNVGDFVALIATKQGRSGHG
ncbi:acyl carrier protein [Teichococcus vastitatis]|uniref:Acyl carrier protein n=1 Tax=Teichococcus vastitatis TaxID=2307076 RepID=A0ABS9W8Z3_9PROT|nr:acyl carrier protein [Pseudoroseomonas vastitatis]MCI0755763.1 acyl carrier protein [Pseudoroseomonas vastitatis]